MFIKKEGEIQDLGLGVRYRNGRVTDIQVNGCSYTFDTMYTVYVSKKDSTISITGRSASMSKDSLHYCNILVSLRVGS